MTDSRGDVSLIHELYRNNTLNSMIKVAYLMADVSDVDSTQIKELYEQLESLSCTLFPLPPMNDIAFN